MVRWVRGEGGGLSSVVDEAKMWLLCGCARYGLKPSVDGPRGGMMAAEMMLRCAVGLLVGRTCRGIEFGGWARDGATQRVVTAPAPSAMQR